MWLEYRVNSPQTKMAPQMTSRPQRPTRLISTTRKLQQAIRHLDPLSNVGVKALQRTHVNRKCNPDL